MLLAFMLSVGGWEERMTRLFERANTILATRGQAAAPLSDCALRVRPVRAVGSQPSFTVQHPLDSANRLVASHEAVSFR